MFIGDHTDVRVVSRPRDVDFLIEELRKIRESIREFRRIFSWEPKEKKISINFLVF